MRSQAPRLPALTDAECSFIDHYLALVDLLARINPARGNGRTYPCLRAAQSLPGEARALLEAIELMWERGEREIHVSTLTRALRALDGERRTARVTVPSQSRLASSTLIGPGPATTRSSSQPVRSRSRRNKERLFSDIILGMTERVEEFLQALPLLLQDADDLEETLGALGRRYITSVIHPDVLQVRRLVVREAGRFPELARTYQRAPQRTVVTLASCLQRLADRGLLRLEDPLVAANHFAFLILGIPLDRAMFGAEDDALTPADHERLADAGVRVFLAAYDPR